MTEFMEEVLIDDNMVFDIDNLKGFLNDTSSFGFIAKENNKIIGFAYCYTLLCKFCSNGTPILKSSVHSF